MPERQSEVSGGAVGLNPPGAQRFKCKVVARNNRTISVQSTEKAINMKNPAEQQQRQDLSVTLPQVMGNGVAVSWAADDVAVRWRIDWQDWA